jgi:hypothetical protein
MDHGKHSISARNCYARPRSGATSPLAGGGAFGRLRRHWPARAVMMRAKILVVAALTVLLHGSSMAYAQVSQTSAEIASNGIEVPLADCGAGGAALHSWAVISDPTASSGAAIEHARAASIEAPAALSGCRSIALKDGDISLRFKPLPGADAAGGLAFRVAGPDDYYLVKIDALRDRASLLLVQNGGTEEIVGVDADVAVATWHVLAVQVRDERFTVYLDGTWIFTGFDKALPHADRIALWAEPGSLIRFDRITTALIPRAQSWR